MNAARILCVVAVSVAASLSGCGGSGDNDSERTDAQVISISIGDVRVSEGNAGPTAAIFTVTASPAPESELAVEFTTEAGTATAGQDLTLASGTLRIPRGIGTQPISVTISGDTVPEGDETFFVNLVSAPNASITDGQGIGTILNDDQPLALQAEPTGLAIARNSGGTLTLVLSGAADESLEFAVTSTGVPMDLPDTVMIPAGQSQGYISVVAGDQLGSGVVNVQNPDVGTLAIPVNVDEQSFTMDVSPDDLLYVGDVFTVSIQLGSPAPDQGVKLDLSLSDEGTASVDNRTITVPSGQSEAEIRGRALAIGIVEVSVLQRDRPERRLGFVLGVRQGARASETLTSFELIEAAQVAGEIGEEDATVYKVMASLYLPELPAQFVGAPDAEPYKHGLRWLVALYPSLSEATRERVNQYLMPPGYEGAWSLILRNTSEASAVTPMAKPRSAGALNTRSVSGKTLCGSDDDPSPLLRDGWSVLVTAHFNVHYDDREFTRETLDTPEVRRAAAAFGLTLEELSKYMIGSLGIREERRRQAHAVAGAAEHVYQSLTQLMEIHPISDADYPCNGSDGAVDIWMQLGRHLYGETVPYELDACSRVPAFIRVGSTRHFTDEPDDAFLRAVLAHEFMHVLQFSFVKGAACSTYNWMDEATAQWAMDYVYPKTIRNMEHKAAERLWRDYDSRNGVANRLAKFRVPLDKAPTSGHRACMLGYCDYPLFLYVARRYEPGFIRKIYESTSSHDGLGSIDAGLAPIGGLAEVFVGFASASWNNYSEKHADEFYRWDALRAGMFRDHMIGSGTFAETIQARLDGQTEKVLSQEIIERLSILKPEHRGSDGFTRVYRLSVQPLRFVFDDANVSSVAIDNRPEELRATTNDRVRAIAHYKIAGQWRGPEDWTDRTYITFCRDVTDERIEELVLLYTNVDVVGRGLEGSELDPNGNAVGVTFTPRVRISNAGCWRWSGTTRREYKSFYGGFVRDEAHVTFEREVNEATGIVGTRFTPIEGGKATVTARGQLGPAGCTVTIEPTEGPILPTDGWLDLHANWGADPTDTSDFERVGDPYNRLFAQGTGMTHVTATSVFSCEGVPALIQTKPEPVPWLEFFDSEVSQDGKHLEMRKETKLPDGSVMEESADLTADREN